MSVQKLFNHHMEIIALIEEGKTEEARRMLDNARWRWNDRRQNMYHAAQADADEYCEWRPLTAEDDVKFSMMDAEYDRLMTFC